MKSQAEQILAQATEEFKNVKRNAKGIVNIHSHRGIVRRTTAALKAAGVTGEGCGNLTAVDLMINALVAELIASGVLVF